jgi:DNA-binding transcriptional LysR family regulator
MMREGSDLNGIDLNLLPKFRALYRHRNVSEAARELYLTQSALSNALAKMRSLFSDELFVRTATGMEPTPLAHSVAESIEKALTQLQTELVRARGFDPRKTRRTFRIAATQLGELWLVPRLLADMQNTALSVVVGSIGTEDRGFERTLSNGSVDFAIGHLPQLGHEFRHQELAIQEYVCVVRNEHPVLKSGPVTLKSLMSCTFVEIVELGLAKINVPSIRPVDSVAPRYQAANVLTVPHIVAATDLAALIPAWFAVDLSPLLGLRLIRLPEESRRMSIRLFWHENFERDPGNCWMRLVIERAASARDVEVSFESTDMLTVADAQIGAA